MAKHKRRVILFQASFEVLANTQEEKSHMKLQS